MSEESLRGMRLGIVGAGVMAEAMLAGLLERDLVDARNVVCTHPRLARREALVATHHVNVAEQNIEATTNTDVVLLGVKPQMLGGVMAELRGALHPEQLVISIIAGATTTALGEGLDHPAVVRCMPNTPAQIGRGVTVWYATESVDEVGKARTRAMLAALGREFEVHDERQVAMATAVSGTGPDLHLPVHRGAHRRRRPPRISAPRGPGARARHHAGERGVRAPERQARRRAARHGDLAGRNLGGGAVSTRARRPAHGGERRGVGGVRANPPDRGDARAAHARLREHIDAEDGPALENLNA